MQNHYMELLESLTIEQLQKEAKTVRDNQPEKAALVYDHLIEIEPDILEKVRYQRLASCYANIAQDSTAA